MSTVHWSSRVREGTSNPLIVVENGWKVVALLSALGGSVGFVSLAFAHVVRPGVYTLVYAVVVSLSLVLAVVVSRLRRLGAPIVLVGVLGGDVAYLACFLCVVDARLNAAPLMLLFPTLVGALYLPWRGLVAHLVALPVLIGVALQADGAPVLPWLVQVLVSTSMLTGAALIVFFLATNARCLLSHSQRLAYRDPLSGLLNRRGLFVESEVLHRRVVADRGQLAAFAIDIDHFKRVNDVYGHAAGDEVLTVVAGAIGAATDPAALAARIGGEEFLVLQAAASAEVVETTADRLHSAVARAVAEQCPQWPVTVSVGTAQLDPASRRHTSEVLRTLVARADQALYAAKRGGRNRVVHCGDAGPQEEPFPAAPDE